MIQIAERIQMYRDTCNVYVIRSGSAAVLIDFGRGDVLSHLGEADVRNVDWLLHTHHHREQCQGDRRAVEEGIPIAVPEREAGLFQNVEHYWNEQFLEEWTCEGAPYVRPLRASVAVSRELREGDTVACGDLVLTVLDTPGHSFGSVSYLLEADGKKIAFIGDLFMNEGKLINFYDSEWDYGYCAGLKATVSSCRKLLEHEPDLLLPSHGQPIEDGAEACRAFADRLEQLVNRYYLRDYDMSAGFEPNTALVTEPTVILEADLVSPHLIRWKDSFGNMYILLGDNRNALLVDAGIIRYGEPQSTREAFLGERLDRLMEHYAIRSIDAVVLTHYHGDHLDIYPFIRRKYGAPLWCFENVAEVVEYPERFQLTCLLPNYGIADRIKADRVLREGECLEWGGYSFELFHLPGQTWHAMGMIGAIDGVRAAFTGDNLFYSRRGSGHDAFVTRNRVILEEGYLKCAEVLRRLQPEKLLCGHSVVIDQPAVQIEKLYEWAQAFRNQLLEFSPEPEYEWGIDPYWAELYPYRSLVRDEREVRKTIRFRNHRHTGTVMKGRLCVPEGWTAQPGHFEVHVGPRSAEEVTVTVEIPLHARPGRYPVSVDIAEGGNDWGELFDGTIEIAGGFL